jgi:hypothetical protein
MGNPMQQAPGAKGEKKFKQEVDTNVFQVSMSCLENQPAESIPQEQILLCSGCNAVFNKHSKVAETNGSQVWDCEFCMKSTPFTLTQAQVPTQEEVTYCTFKPEPVVEETKNGEQTTATDDGSSIIFCLDISGSMGGGKLEMMKDILVKRIDEMNKSTPEKKLGFLCFGSDVNVFSGDGKTCETMDR